MVEVPAFYFGLCKNPGHAEWLKEYVLEITKDKFLDGTIPLQCGTPMPPENDEAHKDTIEPPTMSILTWSADKKNVTIPKAILDQWTQSTEYGPQLEEFVAKHGLSDTTSASIAPTGSAGGATSVAPTGSVGVKRACEGDDDNPSKRAKKDEP